MLQPKTKPEPWRRPRPWPLPIETERLVLRLATHDDVPAIFEAIDSNRQGLLPWMEWAERENLTIGQTHYTIERFIRDVEKDLPDDLPILICDRESGEPIGGTGMHSFRTDTHQAEIGYWVLPGRRKAGVCTEAVVALTQVGFRPQDVGGMGLRRLEIVCSADNPGSARVAEKAGYDFEARHRAHRWVDGIGWSDTLIFGMTIDFWTKP